MQTTNQEQPNTDGKTPETPVGYPVNPQIPRGRGESSSKGHKFTTSNTGSRNAPVRADHTQRPFAAQVIDGKSVSNDGRTYGDFGGSRTFNYGDDGQTRMTQQYVENMLSIDPSRGQARPVPIPLQTQLYSSQSGTKDVTTDDEMHQIMPMQRAGHFGNRHQSVDVANRRAGTQMPFVQPKPSQDGGNPNGFALSYHSPLIEEVRKNNYQKVSKIMDQFIVGKNDSGTVTGRDTQQRNRFIKNTFQTGMTQKRRSTFDKASTKYTDPDYPGAVGPKTEISVPKHLILYQLSKNMDAGLVEQSINGSALEQTVEVQDSRIGGSNIDFFKNSIMGQKVDPKQVPRQQTIQETSHVKDKKFQTIEPLKSPAGNLDIQRGTQQNNFNQFLNEPVEKSFQQRLAPALKTFHITDLLERSIFMGSKEREPNKLRQIVDFYKRSVKPEQEFQQLKEILIRNYRLHVVSDKSEIDEDQRALFTLNKGTSIHVSNSVIKPEIHKFSTEVTDKLVEAYADILGEEKLRPKLALRMSKARNFGRRTKSMMSGMSGFSGQIVTAQQELPVLVQLAQLQNEEDQMLKQEIQSVREQDEVGITDEEEGKGEMMEMKMALTSRANDSPRKSTTMQGSPDFDYDGQEISSSFGKAQQVPQSRAMSQNQKAEIIAIDDCNKIFDRWLRNILSKQSAMLGTPERPLLKNNQRAAPGILDINWKIALENNEIIKEKPLPLEMLTKTSFFNETPYRHLQLLVVNQDIRKWYSKFVLRTQSVRTYKEIANKELQAMNFSECKVAIDFSRHHLTHLDPVIFPDDNLPLELFLDHELWIKNLTKELKELKISKELCQESLGLPARTDYYKNDGTRLSFDVQVQDFDPYRARFFVESHDKRIQTWRSRLYIRLESDKRESLELHKQEVMNRKAASLHYLRLHRLIQEDMTKRYSYLRLPNDILVNINKRIKINLLQFNMDSVRKLILQIEALFVFSVLKSVLSSQKSDPFLKGLLLKYKVPLNSPALSYFKPKNMEKKDLEGVEHYNMKGIKMELDYNSLLLMDEKYIKLPIFLNSLTSSTIGAQKLFVFPFNINILLSSHPKEFRKMKKEEVAQQVQEFPLQHTKFVAAQKIMTQYFHQIAKFRWAEQIQAKIWSFVKDDFNFDQGKELQADQIDPVLLRLFYQLKLYMQTILFDHFENGLRDYMKFLLGFVMRDEELKESKVIEEIRFNEHIRLEEKHKLKLRFQQGEVVNDLELIRLQTKPMICIDMQIEDFEVPGKLVKKQKIITKPELDEVSRDMFSVILNMHDSLQNIDRVDGIIFPLLKMEDPHLLVPDVKNNDKLANYIRCFEKVIDQCLRQTRKEIQNINQHMFIFERRLDNMIINLKKATAKLQAEGSENEDEKQGEESSPDQKTVEEDDDFSHHESEEEEDSYGEDEEDEDGDEDLAADQMAYQSVDIDDGLMMEELFFLRDMIWKVLENVHNQYDFGLVYLDCTSFKDRIIKHIRELIEKLEHTIWNEFTLKQNSIQQEIVGVRGKLDMKVESIDDVIMLLDYIESLNKQDNKIGDIKVMIDELSIRMSYVEQVKIVFPDEQYFEFLEIRNWPRTFKQYIIERRQELLAQKDDLYKEMSKEIDEVFEKIKGFKETIAEVLLQGLVEKELTYDAEEDLDLDSMGSQDKPPSIKNETPSPVKEEIPTIESADGKTFPWLSKEINMSEMKFDIDTIEEVYHKIEHLKSNFDEVERSTALINKRETLLSVPKTQFSELRVIQDDLKPLYELWFVASRFCRTLPQWVEGRFDTLEAGFIENLIDEWINELKRLQKTNLITSNPKQKELQKFMYDSLNHFKRYGPMLRTLRTKGLVARHWRMIGQKLEFKIDPSNITLYRLIQLELYDEDKLKTIKQICEIATKEYAVQIALESLDREMRSVEFEFLIQSDGETVTITRLPDLISMFEEFFLRVSVLKTNPHIKNFYEKLLEIEKIIKNVVELINEWAVFQRNFVYLNGIFVLDEIAKSLPVESKFFLQVQQLYMTTTHSLQTTPQVFKINFRESFLTVLMRSNQDCEVIRNGLQDFLEKKRGKFPRLFFLSNEELVDIFGKGAELVETMIEEDNKGFVSNLFEGIDNIVFNEVSQVITHIESKEKESIHLVREVSTRHMTVDSWLKGLESQMILTLKDKLFLCFEDMGLPSTDFEDWTHKWPGQTTFLCSQIWFSMKINSIFLGTQDRMRAQQYAGNDEGEDEEQESKEKYDEEEEEDYQEDYTHKYQTSNSGLDYQDSSNTGQDPDRAEQRIYEEEVNRQIAKDEQNMPERAQLEKILRLKRRFRVNKNKPGNEQMDKVYLDISAKILLFTSMVRKKLKGNIRQSTVGLLTCHVYFRDIVQGLIRDKIYRADEFKWQMQFKFEMKNMLEVVYKSAFDSGSVRRLETNKLEVEGEVFGYTRQYGFEYLGNCPRLVVTPLTERCQRSLLVALQYHYGGAPEGPFGTGKTETTKDLSRQIAKLCFVLNCSANYEYAGVSRFFKGLASSGAWVCFDEFNRMETHILSLISQVIISIQTSLKQQSPFLQLDESKIPLKQDCAIFITLNPGYAGRSELPINLKTLFRPVSMVVPDSVFITEILLYSSGFVGAQQLAKKIVSVQTLANIIMKKSDIAHDFGLRSIKAIINIAEKLKLQADNIMDSDLTEYIDDDTLNTVNHKADQIIEEVSTESQARITKASDLTGGGSAVHSPSRNVQKKTNRKRETATEELVKIDEAAEIENEQRNIKGLGGTKKDIKQRKGLEQIDETIQGKENEGGGFRDSIQTINNQDSAPKKKGELFDRLWGNLSSADRQIQVVYKQIGIDPGQHYDEEELEEYIILKAVRDFNHSKFAIEEHIIIEGIIKDIFQGAVPDLDKPFQDYGALKDCIHQAFEVCKIDYSKSMKSKALQMYEIQRSKHGVILVGEPQSGKSTLIHLLSSAMNKAAMNEFMLAVSEKRRDALLELAKEFEAQQIEQAQQKQQTAGRSGMSAQDMIGSSVKKKKQKNDKDAQAKKLLQQWQDMYRQTKLTQEQLDQIQENLVIKGVATRRLNPKSMNIEELFGTFDKESHEWHEGMFTQHYREFAQQKDDKKKWIVLDGPIDFMWVENLNSILDENKKMSLPNGEQIKMSPGMCILLETNHLRNSTPATVSRCGLIYLHRKETCNSKAIFNKWLRNLPNNLTEYAKDLDAAANFLMVEVISLFEEEKLAGRIANPLIDLHWLMESFVRLLSCMIFDYYLVYEKSTAHLQQSNAPQELGKSLMNLTLHNKWVDQIHDPNMTIFTEQQEQQPQQDNSQSRAPSRHSTHRVSTPDQRMRDLEKQKRLPWNNFFILDKENDIRIENSLKFTAIWLESFVIFAMTWTFAPVMSQEGRAEMDRRLRAKYEQARTDFNAYQKEKKRKMQEKGKDKNGSKQSLDRTKSRGSVIISRKSLSEKSQNMGSSQQKDSQPIQDQFTSDWTDHLEEKPMLVSDYPENQSFFDYYFNLESNQWSKFSLEMEMNDALIHYNNQLPSQKKIQHFFVPSQDSIRVSFILECLVTCQVSSLVIGPAGCGRSSLMRETLFNHVFQYTKQLITEHVTLSEHTDSTILKENIERLLEWRLNKATGQRRLRPHLDNKLICYIEDMHMCWTDQYGDQPAIEAVREYLTQRSWFSSRKRRQRDIEDVSFFACMCSNSPNTQNVSPRVLHQFNLISMDVPPMKKINARLDTLTDLLVVNWPSAIQMYSQDIVKTIIEVNQRVCQKLKPTPMKAQYTFSLRDLEKILLSMQRIEANSLKKQANVMKLVYHECFRNYCDRLIMKHDKDWFIQMLEEVCRKHFYVVDELEEFHDTPADKEGSHESEKARVVDEIDPKRKDQFLWPIKNPSQVFYSMWNQEVEGFYMEIENVDTIQSVIEANLEKYNDSNERVSIDLMLYNQINRHMLKMLRVLTSPNGHLINVAMKGYGLNTIMKLTTFAAGHQLRELEVHEDYTIDEWQGELRRAIIFCGNEDKPMTFFVDEYKLVKAQMYSDLETLLKNYVVSEITRKSDVMLALANIYEQTEQQKKAHKFGLEAGNEDLTKEQREEKERMEEEQNHEFISDNKKMMQKWPSIQAELYKVFLNRIKNQFHLVLQFSPTGTNFRKKITQNKELLYLSQMIFLEDLNAQELESLGQSFFKLQNEKAVNKSIIKGGGPPKLNQFSATQDQEGQERVLKCVSRMYLVAQEMADQFAVEHKSKIYITPVMFLRMFKTFKKLLRERKVVVEDIQERYEAGLEKIRMAQEEIYKYHQELEKTSPALREKHRELIRIISEIEEEFSLIKGQRDQSKRDEYEAEQLLIQAAKQKDECEEAFNQINKKLNEGIATVQSLSKYDIAELRSMQKPPKAIKLILKTVCILLGVEPVRKRSKKTGEDKFSYWAAAQGPEILGNPSLPQILAEFDRSKITPEIMMEVEDVWLQGNQDYSTAHKASKAALGIYNWLKATKDYFIIQREMQPRRDAFLKSQLQYEEKKKQLENKLQNIGNLDQALTALKEHQKSKDEVSEELKAEISDCNIRKKRADILLKGLSAEKQKWIVCTRMLSSKYTTVTGDVLLSAGYITLICGFNQRFRNKLIQRWTKLLIEEGFACSKIFNFTELFGDSYKIRQWHQNSLPHDETSLNNALVIEKTKRFCLLVDPQMQGVTWLKQQNEELGTLSILKESDYQFKKMIEIAVDMGRTVIVDHVTQSVSLNLQSIMKKQVSKYGGQKMVLFCRKQYKFDENFKLFVICPQGNPHFDVNITNHVTYLNFSVNVESLQAQMMGIVIQNERRDLEESQAESVKDAFDSIKSLKNIEGNILSQLDSQIKDLLGSDILIHTLGESKGTAEFVALKLKNISSTKQFIQKAMDLYSPVAYRASILYFAIRDLQKVNVMYQFSLSWYKQIFQRSLELTNGLKDDPGKLEDIAEEGQSAMKVLNNPFNMEERIDLLLKTFTQELFKKVIMAIFEQDRRVVTYMLVFRVMQAESFVDQSLYEFLISGPKSVNPHTTVPEQLKDCEWMNSMMWAELSYLAKIKPYNQTNLLQHISQNKIKWSQYFDTRGEPLTFNELPNKDLLDLRFFSMMGEDEIEESGQERGDTQSQQHLKGTDIASMAGRTAGDTNSRVGSRGANLMRTESEILNDPEIWNISDSDEDADLKKKEESENEDPQEQQTRQEENEMARFLIEQAPSTGNYSSNISSLRRRTHSERVLINRREKAVKGLCELCLLRCIRPDHLLESMQRYVYNVLDPEYLDFKQDILLPIVQKKQKFMPGQGMTSQGDFNRKTTHHSKMNLSKMSDSQSMSQHHPNPTQGSKLNQGSMYDTNKSGQGMSGTQYTTSSARKAAKEEQERLEKEAKDRRGGLSNINNLIAEAYEDADSRSPIFFLVTHSINILDVVTEFHQKKLSGSNTSKLQYFSLGKGLEQMVEERMAKAAQNGDWIILENLHLVEDWLPSFEEKISRWRGTQLNEKFRMFITCVPVPSFPASILERSIKIAIQPPRTIKQKIEKMLIEQEKEQFFRKSGKNSNYHKNLFFALAYLHSILECRGRYGTLGWNVPYKFDFSDFEVSNSQMLAVLKSNSNDQLAGIDMLKYFYANINYAGKIQRVEDQLILNSTISDLFNEQIIMSQDLPADFDSSHYGFPVDGTDYMKFLETNFPQEDTYLLFGFNWNIECSKLKKDMFEILSQVYQLGKNPSEGSPVQGSDPLSTSIEMNSLKASLRSSKSLSSSAIQKMLIEKDSLLNLFIALQKLLHTSSLDLSVMEDIGRYDHNVDQEHLPRRDLHDQKVVELSQSILAALTQQFDEQAILKKFPIRYKAPLNNVINRELTSFSILLRAIRDSVADLLANIDGKYPRPYEIEALWAKIQSNQVPDKWLKVSFQTTYTSLADYIVELGLKLEFWQKLVNTGLRDMPSFWLPAFYDPKSFLTALRQTRARLDGIPMRELRNDYQIMKIVENTELVQEKNTKYVHGLALEGADWDFNLQILRETTHPNRYLPFPTLKIKTKRVQDASGNVLTPIESYANFSVNKAQTKKTKKRDKQLSPSSDDPASLTSPKDALADQLFTYRCPIFKTTLRLSAGLVAEDNVAIEYLKLNSTEKPSKWTKRGVALLLETDRSMEL